MISVAPSEFLRRDRVAIGLSEFTDADVHDIEKARAPDEAAIFDDELVAHRGHDLDGI